MSDEFFDTDRQAGIYPPKGWGWKSPEQKRRLLQEHFAKENPRIDQWMIGAVEVLGIELPK